MKKIIVYIVITLFVSNCVNNQTADELYRSAEAARNEKNVKSALSNLELLLNHEIVLYWQMVILECFCFGTLIVH